MPATYEELYKQYEEQEPFDYNNFTKEYQAGKKPVLDMIMGNYKKPEPEIDPETAKKAKYAASLTDTLSTLAEMFAHGQGAYVRNRAGQPTNSQTTNAKLQASADKHEAAMQRYISTEGNAKLQDFNIAMQTAQQARGEKRAYYLRKAEQSWKEAQAKTKADADADKLREQKRHNIAMENKPTGADKKTDEKTIPVFVNNKQHNFPANMVEEVVARAIKDGVVGNITTGKDNRGRPIVQKVTPTSSLTAAQKQAIFQSIYPRYIKEGDDGTLLIRRGLSVYDKQSGISAQDKLSGLKPKQQKANVPQQPQSNLSTKSSSGNLY